MFLNQGPYIALCIGSCSTPGVVPPGSSHMYCQCQGGSLEVSDYFRFTAPVSRAFFLSPAHACVAMTSDEHYNHPVMQLGEPALPTVTACAKIYASSGACHRVMLEQQVCVVSIATSQTSSGTSLYCSLPSVPHHHHGRQRRILQGPS